LIRAALVLLLSATPALAEGPLLTVAFPGETLTVPQGTPVPAETTLDLSGKPAVYVRLPQPYASSFAAMTGRHVGQIITIALCGATLSRPMLQTPITGGALVLTGTATAEDAARTATRLNDGRCD
jgi:preprotein translocase subunit SecD